MDKYDVALVGGDLRTFMMAPIFEQRGYRVIYCKTLENAIKDAACVVGGIPLFKAGNLTTEDAEPVGSEEFLQFLQPGQMLFGGVISDEVRMYCEKKGIVCHDFMREETIAVFNAIATAEGTIFEAIRHKDTNIHNSPSLVMGYGRCAKVLADKLKGLDADVTVCARSKEALSYANAAGLKTLELAMLKSRIGEFEYVYNTIPSMVITKEVMEQMRKDVLIIDIASGAGGIDYEAAEKMKVSAFLCPGLPGKYAPRASAQELARYVISVYTEDYPNR